LFQQAQTIDFSRNLCRTVDELDNDILLQKVVRGPLLGGYILTDRFNKPITDTVFYDKTEAIDFSFEYEKNEPAKE